jgi:stringent starvation protein B
MKSSKPYLIRALYEWIVDNDCTPYVLVAVDLPNVQVPEGYGENGQLVLNFSPSAVRNLNIGDDAICFEARFAGIARQIYIPIYAVLAIYAQENGQGMFFEAELGDINSVADEKIAETKQASSEADDPEPPEPPTMPSGGKPSLRIVK